jgi:hypothetical protein
MTVKKSLVAFLLIAGLVASPRIARAGAAEDPLADMVLLTPTAEVQPSGTWYFANYGLFGFQVGQSFGRVQISGLAILAVPLLTLGAGVSAKVAIVREGRLRFAVNPSALAASIYGDRFVVLSAAGIVDLCLDEACHSRASLGVAALHDTSVPKQDPTRSRLGARGSATLTCRLGERTKLLLLGERLVGATSLEELSNTQVGVGLRLFWARFALDVGVIAARQSEFIPLPMLTMTRRW